MPAAAPANRRSMRAAEEGSPSKAIVPAPDNKKGIRGAPGSAASAAEKSRSVGAFAVQCAKCFKFRLVSTQEEYEEIRQNFTEEPWVCDRKSDVSCDDPADLDYDSTVMWVIDKPNIPKSPPGCKRGLTMRKDLSKMDAYYTMPNGKKVRGPRDVEQFLEACPEYRGQFSVPDFNFTVPKIMKEMIPGKSEERDSASASKRMKC